MASIAREARGDEAASMTEDELVSAGASIMGKAPYMYR